MGCEEPDAHNGEFVVPRILRSKADADDEEGEEEGEDESQNRTEKSRDEFVQNPALLREQAEQRRLSRMSRRGSHRPGPLPRQDVVGMIIYLISLLLHSFLC